MAELNSLIESLQSKSDYGEFCGVLNEAATNAFKYMSSEVITPKTCLDAVMSNPANIQFVPDQFLTTDLLWAVIKKDPINAVHVRKGMLTKDMLWYIVLTNPMAIEGIIDNLNESMLCVAIVKNHDCFKFIKNPSDDLLYVKKQCSMTTPLAGPGLFGNFRFGR